MISGAGSRDDYEAALRLGALSDGRLVHLGRRNRGEELGTPFSTDIVDELVISARAAAALHGSLTEHQERFPGCISDTQQTVFDAVSNFDDIGQDGLVVRLPLTGASDLVLPLRGYSDRVDPYEVSEETDRRLDASIVMLRLAEGPQR